MENKASPEQEVHVGIAELKTARPPLVLVTLGLGSCVGVALYDATAKIAGLAHIMLPDIDQVRNQANRGKFANTAIVDLVELMSAAGADKRRLKAKIAGGAHMFGFVRSESIFNIGNRNVEKVKETLNAMNIRLMAEDTGGNYGRSVYLFAENGNFVIRSVAHGESVL
ncbi:MAG: chemotaxis protein CheD [Candidatus Omnitrophica bacterium]|nr:chemotaxis protein CheD [Candidatus Omnitrophota bacterium]